MQIIVEASRGYHGEIVGVETDSGVRLCDALGLNRAAMQRFPTKPNAGPTEEAAMNADLPPRGPVARRHRGRMLGLCQGSACMLEGAATLMAASMAVMAMPIEPAAAAGTESKGVEVQTAATKKKPPKKREPMPKAPPDQGTKRAKQTFDYTADLAQPAERQGTISVAGARWTCKGRRCTVQAPWPTPAVKACSALAKVVGQVRSYGHASKKLSRSQLKQCNAGVSALAKKLDRAPSGAIAPEQERKTGRVGPPKVRRRHHRPFRPAKPSLPTQHGWSGKKFATALGPCRSGA